MELLSHPGDALEWCAAQRARGASVGFVPTMGALHEGHLELVRRAARENDLVVVSVFVNPLQFNDPRDLERYPRDLEGDAALVASAGGSMLFTGTLEQFFPDVTFEEGRFPPARLADPGPCAEGLEGEARPGHFAGVATIVERLFQIVRPDHAYFGAKDYQQCLVVQDLAGCWGGLEVVVCPTVREPEGLARSSRNQLLDPTSRERALALSRGLFQARDAWSAGERDPERLAALVAEQVQAAGLELEYAAVRDPERWSASTPTWPLERAVALVAARAGAVRLIDNLELSEVSAQLPPAASGTPTPAL